jgi:hypothetical protein
MDPLNFIIPLVSTIGCTCLGYWYGRLTTRYKYQYRIGYWAASLRYATKHRCADIPPIIKEMEDSL